MLSFFAMPRWEWSMTEHEHVCECVRMVLAHHFSGLLVKSISMPVHSHAFGSSYIIPYISYQHVNAGGFFIQHFLETGKWIQANHPVKRLCWHCWCIPKNSFFFCTFIHNAHTLVSVFTSDIKIDDTNTQHINNFPVWTRRLTLKYPATSS